MEELSKRLQSVLAIIDERVSLKHVHRRLQGFARVLIVGTFMDDALRVTCDYLGQIHTMKSVGIGEGMGEWTEAIQTVLPSVFIMTQSAGVLLILTRLAPQAGCIILIVWAAIHPFLYAQQTNLEFLLESVTIIGGIIILLTSERAIKMREMRLGGHGGSAGTPAEAAASAAIEKNQLLFAGRIMLSAVFVYYSVKMCKEQAKSFWGGPLSHEDPVLAVLGGAMLVALMLLTGAAPPLTFSHTPTPPQVRHRPGPSHTTPHPHGCGTASNLRTHTHTPRVRNRP